MAKAAVLPVPVCASPRTSRPSRAAGMVRAWIGRGESKPASAIARLSGDGNRNVAKPASGRDVDLRMGVLSVVINRARDGLGTTHSWRRVQQ